MRQRGAHLKQGLHDLGPVVADVRGAGLLAGTGPDGDRAVDVQQTARERGVLVNAAAPHPAADRQRRRDRRPPRRFAAALREVAGPQPAAA
ncbi:hypothetical protein [Streptomyces sp. NPDC005301]|uniref:hypothetical protein n=1 Tax=unclassified Streptomyces TaxID=2593676 RepID=UPI0033B8EA5E